MARTAKIVVALAACVGVVAGCDTAALAACNTVANNTVLAGNTLPKHQLCNATAQFEWCFIYHGASCSAAVDQFYRAQIARIRANLTASFGVECAKGAPTTTTKPLFSGDSGSASGPNTVSSGSMFKRWQLLLLALCLCCCCCGAIGGGIFAAMSQKKKKGAGGRRGGGDRVDYEMQEPRGQTWNDLPRETQMWYSEFGWEQASFDGLSPPPAQWSAVWGQLSPAQQECAGRLGYDAASWDATRAKVEMPVPAAVPTVIAEEIPVVVETPQGPVVEEVIVEQSVEPEAQPLLFGPPDLLSSVAVAAPAVAAPTYTTTVGPTTTSSYATYPYGNYGYSAPSYTSAPAVTSTYTTGYTTGATSYATPGTYMPATTSTYSTYASPGGVV